jgi:hypothetical protein
LTVTGGLKTMAPVRIAMPSTKGSAAQDFEH